MPRPCHCVHPLTPAGGGCHWCDLYHGDPAYRALWGDDPAPGSRPLSRAVRPCRRTGGWVWTVSEGDWVRARGEEPTEAEAWAEADAVA